MDSPSHENYINFRDYTFLIFFVFFVKYYISMISMVIKFVLRVKILGIIYYNNRVRARVVGALLLKSNKRFAFILSFYVDNF